MNSVGRLDLNLSIAFQWMCSTDRIYKPLCFTLLLPVSTRHATFTEAKLSLDPVLTIFSKTFTFKTVALKNRLVFTFTYLVFGGIHGVRRQLRESVSFHHVGYRDQTQVIRIGIKQSSLLSHLTIQQAGGELCTAWVAFRSRMMSTMMSAGSL